jgi:hypothetical protein
MSASIGLDWHQDAELLAQRFQNIAAALPKRGMRRRERDALRLAFSMAANAIQLAEQYERSMEDIASGRLSPSDLQNQRRSNSLVKAFGTLREAACAWEDLIATWETEWAPGGRTFNVERGLQREPEPRNVVPKFGRDLFGLKGTDRLGPSFGNQEPSNLILQVEQITFAVVRDINPSGVIGEFFSEANIHGYLEEQKDCQVPTSVLCR